MDLNEKKRAASEFLQGIGDPSKRQRVFETMADDGAWCVPLKGAGPPFSKAQILGILDNIDKIFKEPLKLTIHGITAEGDRVAVECEGYVPTINGKIYNNSYHFLITFKGDKIQEVKEYNDSKHADETFAGLF